MFIELHILQNVAPANLNRDDTGAPKDCTFGGYRRSRVSSQALKRATRMALPSAGLDAADLGLRTRRVLTEVTERLTNKGRDEETAKTVVRNALASVGLNVDKNDNNQYLLFLGPGALDRFADKCDSLYDQLAADKKLKKGEIAGLVAEDLLDARGAIDVALFGRMIADLPEHTIDAACQVAHAISTHEVNTEYDYFTAVDDLLPDSDSGAGMIGTVEFNAACLYRYSSLDTTQLVENLDGDTELALRGVRSYLEATVLSLPSGKQNSMAAHNPPSLVLAVNRQAGQWNLANAFEDPARPTRSESLVHSSASALLGTYADLSAAYGRWAPQKAALLTVGLNDIEPPGGIDTVSSLDDLIDAVATV